MGKRGAHPGRCRSRGRVDGDARERIGRSARQHVRCHFTTDVMKAKTLRVYDEVLGAEAAAGTVRAFGGQPLTEPSDGR